MKRHWRGLWVPLVCGVFLLSVSPAAASGLRWSAGRDRRAGNLIEVACPSKALCVAVNNAGGVAVSTHPARGARSWRVVRGLKILQLGGTLAQQNDAAMIDIMAFDLSCPSVHLCVVGRPGAEASGSIPGEPPIASVVYTTDPAGRASAWHTVNGIGGNAGQIASLTCPALKLCYALENVSDKHGNITATALVSTDPTGPASVWTKTGGTIGNYTEGIACPSHSVCVTATGLGMYSTADAAGPASTWNFATDTNQEGQIDAVTCASTHLCIAQPDLAGCIPCGAGNDLISTNPVTGRWRRAAVATGDIACPTSKFCVGTAAGTRHASDELAFSTDPDGPARAWHYISRLTGRPRLRGIACASSSFCVAVGDGGAIAVGRGRR
jgi:hypothetical protein